MTDVPRRLYRLLVDPEEDHGCGELPDEACREVPANATKVVGALTLTKFGDEVVDAKTVLTWLLTGLGAPAAFVGMLVPVREAGSLTLQAMLVPFVRRLGRRKWAWVAASVAQAVAVGGIAWAAATLTGRAVGWVVLAALAGFALARSVGSIASKDVLGKTVPQERRGAINGWAASFAGAGAIVVGAGLALVDAPRADAATLAWLIGGGALLWVLAAFSITSITEHVGEHDPTVEVGAIGRALALLVSDADFRRFVLVRAMLLVTALSSPFVVAMAAGVEGDAAGLGPFVVASGVASLIGAPVWGKLADRSSRAVMTWAAALGTAVVAAFLGGAAVGSVATWPWFYVLVHAALAVCHAGARIGRQTYVVNMAEGSRRTDYVAVSNTAMGVILLVIGGGGALLSTIGPQWSLVLLGVLGLAGAISARTLPEVGGAGRSSL